MSFKVTISGMVLKESINSVQFLVEQTNEIYGANVKNTMIISGMIGEDESTVELYKWAVMPGSSSDCYKEVSVEEKRHDKILRKVVYSKAFVVDYSENYSNAMGNGMFLLTIRQLSGNDVVCTSEEGKKVEAIVDDLSTATDNLEVPKVASVAGVAAAAATVANAVKSLKSLPFNKGLLPDVFDALDEVEKLKNIEALKNMSPDALKFFNKCVDCEKLISKDIKGIVEECGGELAGFAYRLKTPASFLEKIGPRAALKGISEKAMLSEINDVVRYTQLADKDKLVDSFNKTMDTLKGKGYNVKAVKNTWNDVNNPYKGINSVLESPNGQKFELQFHTPESFELKQGEMHKLYEESRKLDPASDEAIKLNDKMFKLSNSLEKPKDIGKVVSKK